MQEASWPGSAHSHSTTLGDTRRCKALKLLVGVTADLILKTISSANCFHTILFPDRFKPEWWQAIPSCPRADRWPSNPFRPSALWCQKLVDKARKEIYLIAIACCNLLRSLVLEMVRCVRQIATSVSSLATQCSSLLNITKARSLLDQWTPRSGIPSFLSDFFLLKVVRIRYDLIYLQNIVRTC